MASFIREFENRLLEVFTEGKIAGTIHTALGQEVYDVSLMWSLDPETDQVFGNHRNHGQILAWGTPPQEIFAEIMGRKNGVSGGYGGSQHMSAPGYHSSGVQGGLSGVAVGVGLERKAKSKHTVSSVILGDGTLGEGIVYEAMNLAGVWESPTLFTLIDNGIAQSTPKEWTIAGNIELRAKAFGLPTFTCTPYEFSSLATTIQNASDAVRSSQKAGFLIITTDRLGPHSKGDDHRSTTELEKYQKRDLVRQLEDTLDSAIVNRIRSAVRIEVQLAFEKADANPAATVLPPLSERRNLISHAKKEPLESDGEIRQVESLNIGLRTCLTNGAVLLGEDLHDPYGGAFKISRGLSSEFPGKVLSSPISEAAVVGASIGFATSGTPSIAELMFGDFVTLAADQLINQASKLPSIYGKDEKLPVTIRMPSGGYRGYGPTHSQSLESIFFGIPNITVVAPNHRLNSGELLRRAVEEWPYPTVFVEHKLLYGEIESSINYKKLLSSDDSLESLFPTLSSSTGSEPVDVTMIGYGGMVPLMEDAAQILEEEEITSSIVIPSLLSPLPARSIANVLRNSQITVIIEEGHTPNGFGAELIAQIAENYPEVTGPFRRIGALETPIPAAPYLESIVLPTVEKIVSAVTEVLESESI